MTDFVLSSNQSSVILRNLEEREVKDLSYDVGASYPILAKQYREIQPNNTSVVTYGGEIAFNLNKSMLLRDMMIRTSFTSTTTSYPITMPIGLNMYEWIQLRTNNKVIMQISDAYLLARTHQCSQAKQLAIYRRALPLLSTTEVPTLTLTPVTYTPVFCSFFEDIRNSFDLNFYEQLSLVCKVNSQGRGGFLYGATSVSATLWVWSYRPDDKFYDLLRAKNQSPSKPLTMLTYNTYTESQVLTSTTQNTMRLNVNFPVFNTYIMIKATSTAMLAQQVKIDSFTFSVGGTKLLESVPFLVADWESASTGSSSLIPSNYTAQAAGGLPAYISSVSNDSKVICINWGIEPWNRVNNSGAVSFAQINYPSIVVNTTAANLTGLTGYSVVGDFTLTVVNEYWQVLSLDSTNGSCNIVNSS